MPAARCVHRASPAFPPPSTWWLRRDESMPRKRCASGSSTRSSRPTNSSIARSSSQSPATGKSRLIDRQVPAASEEDIEAAVARASKRARPNVLEAIDLVRRAGDGDVHQALGRRTTRLQPAPALGRGEQPALPVLRAPCGRESASRPADPLPVRTVGIAGAGTMGASLTRAFADHGYRGRRIRPQSRRAATARRTGKRHSHHCRRRRL